MFPSFRSQMNELLTLVTRLQQSADQVEKNVLLTEELLVEARYTHTHTHAHSLTDTQTHMLCFHVLSSVPHKPSKVKPKRLDRPLVTGPSIAHKPRLPMLFNGT